MGSCIAGAGPGRNIMIDAVAVGIVYENAVAISVGPVVPEIDHCAGMRVAASGLVLGRASQAILNLDFPGEMQMVGDGRDSLICISAGFPVAPGIVMSALNHMIKVRVNTRAHEAMTMVIPIDAPRVCRSIGIWFPHVADRMITPHSTIENDALILRSARLPWVRPVGASMSPIQPSVGTPG